MGVLGAFVFAAQMINFAIPGTGSSGHIGGGMLLAMLLGPYAALVTMTSVLIVQALIFADGGILALGTNIWNLSFYPCIVGWWLYRIVVGRNPTYARLSVAAMLGILIALEMGALSVAIQTVLSGKSELPLGKFSILMLGIHLPIAVVEGFVTLGVVNFAYRIRPQVVEASLGIGQAFGLSKRSYRPLLGAALAATLLVGGVVAWFASARPDGLEWSIRKIIGSEGIPEASDTLSGRLSRIQEQKALLPNYELPGTHPGTKGPEVREEDQPKLLPGLMYPQARAFPGSLDRSSCSHASVSPPLSLSGSAAREPRHLEEGAPSELCRCEQVGSACVPGQRHPSLRPEGQGAGNLGVHRYRGELRQVHPWSTLTLPGLSCCLSRLGVCSAWLDRPPICPGVPIYPVDRGLQSTPRSHRHVRDRKRKRFGWLGQLHIHLSPWSSLRHRGHRAHRHDQRAKDRGGPGCVAFPKGPGGSTAPVVSLSVRTDDRGRQDATRPGLAGRHIQGLHTRRHQHVDHLAPQNPGPE